MAHTYICKLTASHCYSPFQYPTLLPLWFVGTWHITFISVLFKANLCLARFRALGLRISHGKSEESMPCFTRSKRTEIERINSRLTYHLVELKKIQVHVIKGFSLFTSGTMTICICFNSAPYTMSINMQNIYMIWSSKIVYVWSSIAGPLWTEKFDK